MPHHLVEPNREMKDFFPGQNSANETITTKPIKSLGFFV